ELVERYRLIEPTRRVFEIELENEEHLRLLRTPAAISWLEENLSTENLELFLFVSTRRFATRETDRLFPSTSCGGLVAFKLGDDIHSQQLPEWLQSSISVKSSARLKRLLRKA